MKPVSKATMRNMDEFISKISTKNTENDGEIGMPKINLDSAYGQAYLSKEASKHCVFSISGGELTGHCRFKKGFYGLSDNPIVVRQSIGIENTSLVRRIYLCNKRDH